MALMFYSSRRGYDDAATARVEARKRRITDTPTRRRQFLSTATRRPVSLPQQVCPWWRDLEVGAARSDLPDLTRRPRRTAEHLVDPGPETVDSRRSAAPFPPGVRRKRPWSDTSVFQEEFLVKKIDGKVGLVL
jgi:hypothetical protein